MQKIPIVFQKLKILLKIKDFQLSLMMMIIAPNSHAHKGKKEREEVKGEYGGI